MSTHYPQGISLINQTVMNVLMHAITNEDTRTLESLGVAEDSVLKLMKLSMKGRYMMADSPAPIVQVAVDNIALQLYTNGFLAKETQSKFINSLVKADAPVAMLEKNYGITHNDYILRRKIQGLNKPSRGRPEVPSINNCPKKLISELEGYLFNKSSDTALDENPELLMKYADSYKLGIRDILSFYNKLRNELM